MAIRPTHKCWECKEVFRNEEMVNYATPRSQTSHWYCLKCYNAKLEREKFNDKVCSIFGLKQPSSKLWKQRERLINEYGYTDQTIIDCLEYVYNVENFKKNEVTLGLVNPVSVEKMMKYKRTQKAKANQLVMATKQTFVEHIVPIEENKEVRRKKVYYDPDEWLDS